MFIASRCFVSSYSTDILLFHATNANLSAATFLPASKQLLNSTLIWGAIIKHFEADALDIYEIVNTLK